jgi:hypothetical protein
MRSGKGLKSWFDEKYIDDKDCAHPRWIVPGTAPGRLASSNPNFLNVPKRGFGAAVRAAIIPREPGLVLVKADKRQLELRVVLWYAGAEQPPEDVFTWLVNRADGKFSSAAARMAMSERDVAKSVSHAADYLEGLVVLDDTDLSTKRRGEERRAEALLVFDGTHGNPKWEYRDGYVCFTGANLSERLFGDRSFVHRKDALDLQEIYFSSMPSIRQWHRRLSAEIEKTNVLRSATGRFIRLYGTPEEDLKLAAAALGQGGGADEAQEGMLRFADKGAIALIHVYDELVFERPASDSVDQHYKFFEPFVEPSRWFGGWRFPIEISVGGNWGKWNGSTNPDGMEVI